MLEKQLSVQEKAKTIKCIISDVDGVMTDGSIIYDNAGMEYKKFSVKDGQIIQHLKSNKILIGVITGRDSQVVQNRCTELKMDFHFHGVKNKDEKLQVILKEFGLSKKEIAYVGDDLNDLPILTQIGLSATPSDGHYKVQEKVDLVLQAKGGEGALRELADKVLESQGLYKAIIDNLSA